MSRALGCARPRSRPAGHARLALQSPVAHPASCGRPPREGPRPARPEAPDGARLDRGDATGVPDQRRHGPREADRRSLVRGLASSEARRGARSGGRLIIHTRSGPQTGPRVDLAWTSHWTADWTSHRTFPDSMQDLSPAAGRIACEATSPIQVADSPCVRPGRTPRGPPRCRALPGPPDGPQAGPHTGPRVDLTWTSRNRRHRRCGPTCTAPSRLRRSQTHPLCATQPAPR